MLLLRRNWLLVLSANHMDCYVEIEANEKLCWVKVTKAIRTQWLSKVGWVWDDTLHSLKGPDHKVAAFQGRMGKKNALSQWGQVFTPSASGRSLWSSVFSSRVAGGGLIGPLARLKLLFSQETPRDWTLVIEKNIIFIVTLFSYLTPPEEGTGLLTFWKQAVM